VFKRNKSVNDYGVFKESKFSDITDRILLFIVTMFFATAVAGFFSRDTVVILAAAFASAFCVTALIGLLRKNRRSDIPRREFEETMLQFFCQKEDFAFDTVFTALSKRYHAEKRDGYILINRTAVYPRLSPAPLTLAWLYGIYAGRADNIKRIVILTAAGAERGVLPIAALLGGISVTVLGGDDSYRVLRKLNSLPEITVKLDKKKIKPKEFLLRALSPVSAKRYLFTALFLIGSSFILPNSIYYIAVAAICLGLAFLSKINLADKVKSKRITNSE